MSQSQQDNARSDFGPNEWLVDEMYERYLEDPDSVDKAWRDLFKDGPPTANGGSAPAAKHARKPAADTKAAIESPKPKPAATTPATNQAAVTGSAAASGAAPAHDRSPTKPVSAAKTASAPVPKDEPVSEPPEVSQEPEHVVLRGASARTVANMDTSLAVPTATSVRTVPVKLLIDNRVVINNHLARARGGKVSFTHIIGFALVKALKQMPEMNYGFEVIDGKPNLIKPAHVNLGLAIDVQKPDGTRQLLVPSIKGAEDMSFAVFWTAYEAIVRRARDNKLTVEDFKGTTITLTNPGTIGTNHSVPRLMSGQGAILGVGAMNFPPEYQGASEETLTRNAISKIMTLTSTYDHRVIQGAQSGDFLRRLHGLLLGEDGFYEEIFRALRIPYEPIRWAADISANHEDEISKQARILEMIHAYRVRGHIMADTDPLEYQQRSHPDLEVGTHGLTLWDLDREFATGNFGGRRFMKLRHILGILRDSYCRTTGIEYMHIQDPEQRRWIQERVERPHQKPPARRAAAHPAQAQPGGGVRDVPADEVRRAEAVQSRRRRDNDPADRRDLRGGGRRLPRRGHDRHGAPWSPQRAGQHRRQALLADLP